MHQMTEYFCQELDVYKYVFRYSCYIDFSLESRSDHDSYAPLK